MRLVLAYREKEGIVQLVVSPFWDQSQERLQVAQAVSCWGSTGAEGQAASAWLAQQSVSLFLARTVGKSARSASAMGSEKAAECPAKDFSRGKTCSGGKHFGALAEAKRFGAQTQEARSTRSFACMQSIASGATVQRAMECGFQGVVPHARWPSLRTVDGTRCVQPFCVNSGAFAQPERRGGASSDEASFSPLRFAQGDPRRQRSAFWRPWSARSLAPERVVVASGYCSGVYPKGASAGQRRTRTDASHFQSRCSQLHRQAPSGRRNAELTHGSSATTTSVLTKPWAICTKHRFRLRSPIQ